MCCAAQLTARTHERSNAVTDSLSSLAVALRADPIDEEYGMG
ncbi:MAG: hypothetical protein ACYDCA_03025 [Candidatus Tyrphobacter sp.]